MAKSPRKKKKKKVIPKRKLLRRAAKAAHKAMSLYIRAKFKLEYGKCPLCNDGPIQAVFHIQRAKYVKIMRYDDRNVIASCHKCNWMEYRNPDPSRAWYIKKYGVEQYLEIVEEGKRSFEFTIEYYVMIKSYYDAMLRKLNEEQSLL